jgi:hypothetical protein
MRWLVALALTVVATHTTHAGGITIETQRRTVKSTSTLTDAPELLHAVELSEHLVAIEREGVLEVRDARDGHTIDTAKLTARGIQTVSRSHTGDIHIKTPGDLVAIERHTGRVRWTQRTTSIGNVAATPDAVVDSWVDRETHRFGIVTYDPATGKPIESIDLGATGGWYDREHVELALDGPGEVVVSAMFAVA